MHQDLIFIFGAARSGTTWLAKIFDSHPDVLYRHEPDMVLFENSLPGQCDSDAVAKYREVAKAYLERLIQVRTLKSAGSFPMFHKNYHSAFEHYVRRIIAYTLRAGEAVGGSASLSNVEIPDFIGSSDHPTIVMKSVTSRGRALLFTEALPESRSIFILRHPCGQISSMLRGIEMKKFDQSEIGLNQDKQSSLVEKLALDWAVSNQKVLDDFAGKQNVSIIKYEELCADPIGVATKLFAFAGLAWDEQTADFLQVSTTHSGPNRYYQVFKNSQEAANAWQNYLSEKEQRIILEITGRVPAGQLFASK